MKKIDSYEFGKMVIDGKEYTEDLIIYGDMIIENWRRKKGHILTQKDMKILWDEIGNYKGVVNILIVGTGHDGLMELSDEEGNGMLDQVMCYVSQARTVQAIEDFNECVEKGCNVAGAFHLTC